jgi:hypothetical protein
MSEVMIKTLVSPATDTATVPSNTIALRAFTYAHMVATKTLQHHADESC